MRGLSRGSKKAFLDSLLLNTIGILGSILARALVMTLRVTFEGEEKLERIRANKQKIIYALWHGQLLILTCLLRNRDIHPIISEHRDGEMVARVVKRLGYTPVRGSSTRGGVKVLLEILTKLGNKYDLAITPDGPRGPRWKVQQGVVFLAQKTGLPIVPSANGAERFWELKSWDRFRIPKPFSRALVLYGDPIFIPAELDREGHNELMKTLEETLIALSQELDKSLGVCETAK